MTETGVNPASDVERLIDDAPISGLQKRVIALCSLATFLDGYDVQALGLAIPRMAADFGVAPTAFAGALSGSLAGMAVGAVSLGSLADRYGRRTMLIAMMLLVGLSTFGVMLSDSALSLTIWRVLTGLGIGGSVPIAIAMTSEYAPARRRTALVTVMVVCTALGSFAAGFVAPWIEARFGWRGIFGVGAVLPIVAALMLWAWLPESLRMLIARDPGSPRAARLLSLIAPGAAITQPSVRSAPAVARASVAALFAPRLRQRTMLLWIVFWSNLFVNYSLISWLPTLLASAGWERGAAQRATGLLAIGGIVGGLTLAWLADKGVAVRSLAITYVIAAIVLSLFVLAPLSGLQWLPLILLVGAGAIGAQMALGSYCAGFYPPEIRSTGLGWAGGIGRFGSMIGPLVLAALMKADLAAAMILGLLMVPMLVCAFCVTLLPKALRETP